MKVRICYAIEVSDEFRRALNHRIGLEGPASRENIRQHCMTNGTSIGEDLMWVYENMDTDNDN